MGLLRGVGKLISGTAVPSSARGSRIGRKVAIGAGLAGLGLGMAGKSMGESRPLDTPMLDAAFDIAFGNPQADRAFLGADMGYGDLLPYPGYSPTWSKFRMINAQTFGDLKSIPDPRKSFPGGIIPNRYEEMASEISHRKTRVNATGDMVFGMYNLRNG